MCKKNYGNLNIGVDFENGCVTFVDLAGEQLVHGKKPIFTIRLRDENAKKHIVTAFDAKKSSVTVNDASTVAVYGGFELDIEVVVTLKGTDCAQWYIDIKNNTDMMIEWVNFPDISFAPLEKNGGKGKVVCTYNEGAVVDDAKLKAKSWFPHHEQEYPSKGAYWMFPNMVASQFMIYMCGDKGLYTGAHDKGRAVKGIDFWEENEGVVFQYRLFCGVNYGENFKTDYPIVWKGFEGSWHKGADIYKEWFENNLPSNVKKISENNNLPAWYEKSPFVVSYCVRGVHDMDKMDPNALFPYENALPLIDDIAKKVDSQLMVLLMHWEGTAPWAPPYVWPPYGGEEVFNSFADKLHERGHILGVYCSGFGYTLKSNLVEEYDNREAYANSNLWEAMCVSPEGEVGISDICQGQRMGYDICVASEMGREILDNAYQPLFESKVDYVQILDQNHGGGQYFCYSKQHNHPPAPGKWMTSTMRDLLDGWNERGKGKLFGCESASAEPFMGNLLFSDNRYELNWHIGEPAPVYQYIYHEYLRNFQGNQVSCPFSNVDDTMRARMAYSFCAGDCMTIVITPFGELMANWGCHDFSKLPDKEKTLLFAKNMQTFYKNKAKKYLYNGNMIAPIPFENTYVEYEDWNGRKIPVPCIYSTAWEKDGEKVQIFVNHTDTDIDITFNGHSLRVSATSAEIVNI